MINGKPESDWMHIIRSIVQKMCARHAYADLQELIQEAWLGLLESQKDFNVKQATMESGEVSTTWGCHYIIIRIKQALYQMRRNRKMTYSATVGDCVVDKGLVQVDNVDEVGFYLSELTPEQQRLYEAHVVDDQSYRDLSANMPVSHTIVGRRMHKIKSAVERKKNENARTY